MNSSAKYGHKHQTMAVYAAEQENTRGWTLDLNYLLTLIIVRNGRRN